MNATGPSEPARDAARTAEPDPAGSRDRQRHSRRRLRHAQVPRCHRRTGRCRVRTVLRTSGRHALTPPRKNAKPWKAATAGAAARNEALRASKYLGRALWRRWSGYQLRSRAETKMHRVNRRSAKRNCRASASWRGTSTVRLRGSRFVSFAGSLEPVAFARSFLNGHTALCIPVTKVAG